DIKKDFENNFKNLEENLNSIKNKLFK
ncbi:poly(A) polymerase, partial [Campylobacter jejuni]|nr:poly(A) polymerase [Campylobacter jejuni]EAH9032635.1 poly(A) polymerase [Campylobacter jejuni]EAI0276101.1 poly(A) polymerase [Campylobacter jejuni]EAI2227947.1 poly(A) polymerase [Campylobacter jejuni]EAI3224195.1 poly(A) polymerase [Campylobacter jejuni]